MRTPVQNAASGRNESTDRGLTLQCLHQLPNGKCLFFVSSVFLVTAADAATIAAGSAACGLCSLKPSLVLRPRHGVTKVAASNAERKTSVASEHLESSGRLTEPSKEPKSVLTEFTAAVKSSSRPVSRARPSVYTSVGFKECEHHSNQGTAQRNICFAILFHLVQRVLANRRWGHLFASTVPHANPPDRSLNF
ncbi:hypothetical protein JOB18_002573 [Solea senegalensis]|uniref:Transmembrane protein n=1 Tax=Solea senegalensis TaxID=28829 RepID=A0AAV6T2U5_SOLSE|nr:hypothetical protein JOB18_002573 [Solea senegalensis]